MGVTLYIVRHGNTFGPDEVPRRIGRRTDLPLVESGRAQAEALGIWFEAQGIRFDRAMTSPLLRTRETAALILARQSDPPAMEAEEWLAEIDHGPDENKPEPAVIDRIGVDALKAWDTHSIPPQDWLVDREARLDGWRGLFAQRDSGNTLLVTSNGAARFALLADPDLAAQAARLPSLKLRTGAFGVIRVGEPSLHVLAWDRRP
jgi:broad specificity phosphatase PhoE